MPIARCNGIDICYETMGNPSDRPLFLIMGLGNQMDRWPEPLRQALVDRGHYVVYFDNRDVGHSTVMDDAGVPAFRAILEALAAGRTPEAPYTLSDMAQDTVGLMDALGLPGAHLVGVSLGGMIAQTIALEHPTRTLSLTSLMSTTGRPGLPMANAEGMRFLSTRPPEERDALIKYRMELDRFLTGPHMPYDEEQSRAMAERHIERGVHPDGTARQRAAVAASGTRHERLKALTLPTLIIHGDADPLIDVAAGRDTAASIPGARYIEIPGLAHSLPSAIWADLVDAISELTEQASQASPA